MEIIEKEIVEFANDLLKMYENSFNKLNIIVKEPPRIDNWNRVRNFVIYLWNNKTKTFLLVEFPILVDEKPFCTLSQAKKWIENDIREFVKANSQANE